MEPISLRQILTWTGGRRASGSADAVVDRVSTDSRSTEPGDCFVALVGERFDGHAYIREAVSKGAKVVVYSPERYQAPAADSEAAYVAVDETKTAFQNIARGYRRQFPIPVVGITGSNGKTTTKEMTAAVLAGIGEVAATEKNYNNDVGLPMTLLRIERRHRAAVVEMGMRGTGEIERLAEVAEPTIGVVTNVGQVHLELLKTIDAIADAKAELVRALPPSGTAVLNDDDRRVADMAERTKADVVRYGLNDGATVRAQDVSSLGLAGTEFTLVWPTDQVRVSLRVPGRHHVYNALAAAAVGFCLGMDIRAVEAGLSSFRGAEMRTEVMDLGSGVVVINDAYNSSPASAGAALTLLDGSVGKRKVAVLGDMLELGEYAPRAHLEIGRRAAEVGVDNLIAVGDYAPHVEQGAREGGCERVIACRDAKEAAAAVREVVQPGDIVLVKGSRGVELEHVVAAVRRLFGDGEAPGEAGSAH